jgi:DNA-binding response OmpR family regulator
METTPVGVLIVEDDESSGMALTRILRSAGYGVTWVKTVAEGVVALTPKVRLMLLDLMLPDGYGWDVLARANELGIGLHAVVLTGAGDDVVEQVLRYRPSAVLRKPVDADAVLRWLADLAGRPTGGPPAARTN